jgi:RNA polymerase sigma-70 factor (ECF subfamily)
MGVDDEASSPAGAPEGARRGRFATTRWSLVAAAGASGSEQAERALTELCAEYWYPLYAYVRRRGYDPEDAADLTQSFFVHLLEKDRLAVADPTRGRFRTFLLTSMKNFVNGEWRKRAALKRGGGVEMVPIDFDSAEQRYRIEPSHDLSPEAIYERRWALGLLDRAVEQLRLSYEQGGKGELFEALKGGLGHGDALLPYAELALRLGRSEGNLRSAVFRLRSRWRDQIRSLVAETVADESSVDDELQKLLASIAETS